MGRERTGERKQVYFCFTSLILLALWGCATLTDLKVREEASQHLLRAQESFARGDFEGAIDENEKVLAFARHQPPEDQAFYNLGLIYAHFGYAKKDYGKSLFFFNRLMNDFPQSPWFQQAKIWANILQENNHLSQEGRRLRREEARLRQTLERLEWEATKPPEPRREEPKENRELVPRTQTLLAQGDFEGAMRENQKILALSLRRSPEDEALFNLGVLYAHSGNSKKDYEKSLEFFRRVVSEHPRSPFVQQAKAWIGVLEENANLNQILEKSKQADLEIEQKKREFAK